MQNDDFLTVLRARFSEELENFVYHETQAFLKSLETKVNAKARELATKVVNDSCVILQHSVDTDNIDLTFRFNRKNFK